jgi:hypothetical protein
MANTGLIGLSSGAILGGVLGYELIKSKRVLGAVGGVIIIGAIGYFIGSKLGGGSSGSSASSTSGSALSPVDVSALSTYGNGASSDVETPYLASLFNDSGTPSSVQTGTPQTDQQAYDQIQSLQNI